MRSTVTKRGQTVVPAEVRRRHRIERGTVLEWIDTGTEIRVIALPADPIRALRGSSRSGITEKLLESRRRDRAGERSSRSPRSQ